MKDWKKIGKKLLFIPLWLTILLTLISAAALVLVFVKGWEEKPIAYVVYVLAFYTLTTVTLFCVLTLPGEYKKLKQKFYENPYGNRYMTDLGYKVRVSLYISLGINFFYSVFKLISAFIYSSFWWGAIAVYYIVLAGIRFLLLRYMRSDDQHILSDWKWYRLCGVFMVLINLSLSGIIFQMVWQNRANTYHEIILIAMATYTFYTVTMSIIDLVRYHNNKSPALSAAKAIRFAAALVSLLSLETAMIAHYGESDFFRQVMVGLTGAGVCLIVLGMSVYMIVRAGREINALQNNNSET